MVDIISKREKEEKTIGFCFLTYCGSQYHLVIPWVSDNPKTAVKRVAVTSSKPSIPNSLKEIYLMLV